MTQAQQNTRPIQIKSHEPTRLEVQILRFSKTVKKQIRALAKSDGYPMQGVIVSPEIVDITEGGKKVDEQRVLRVVIIAPTVRGYVDFLDYARVIIASEAAPRGHVVTLEMAALRECRAVDIVRTKAASNV